MLFELRLAARLLRTRPLFTAIAVATLAVGIGANAAIFSVIDAVLLRPLPYPQSERLASLYTRYLPATGYDYPYFALSGPEFADVEAKVDAFSAIAAYGFSFRNLTFPAGEAERVLTMQVTAPFFDVLGIRPARGRGFSNEEGKRKEGCLAVLAHETYQRLIESFAGSAEGIGQTIRLDDTPCTIVGVMPQGFGFRDDRVKVWTPLTIDAIESPLNRQSHPLQALVRLRDDATFERAESELQSLRAYWAERFPDHYAKGHFAVTRPLHEDIVGDQRQALLVLGAAVLFVLLIVCINLSALLVSRGESRRREFAVRQALGADRRRLIKQLLGETILLAAIGGGLGVLLANWMLEGLLALYPERLPVWQAIGIDAGAMMLAFVLVLLTGFLVGLIPAMHATGVRLQETLKAEARGGTATRRALVVRSGLVVAQLGLSLVLLVGTLLLVRTYQHLQRVDLGMDVDRVLTFTVSLPEGRQPDAAAARRALAAIAARLEAAPEVEAAAAISNLPLVSAGPPDDFIIDGRAEPAPGSPSWNARYIMATPRTFDALGIALKRGRRFAEGDGPGQPLVAVVNETAARLYWAGDDPIGRTIRYFPRETSPSIRIVGVVDDVRSLGANAAPPPAVYVPYEQAPRSGYDGRSMTFVVRAERDPASVAPAARDAVQSVDAGLPIANVRPMQEIVRAAMGQPRFTTTVMSFFAVVACFLAALGLYGILAYSVEQRAREIGVRIALGAGTGEILRLIIGGGMRLAGIGILVGVPAALVATRLLRGLLSGVTSTDPVTYGAVIVIFVGAALLASYLPARRATRIDPMVALRAE
jgi:putative ABC transport system permease protein